MRVLVGKHLVEREVTHVEGISLYDREHRPCISHLPTLYEEAYPILTNMAQRLRSHCVNSAINISCS